MTGARSFFQSGRICFSGQRRGFVFLPEFFVFILHCFCGAAVPLCRAVLSLFSYIQHVQRIIWVPYLGCIRTCGNRPRCEAIWRPSCFFPQAWRRDSWHYHVARWQLWSQYIYIYIYICIIYICNHGPLYASHTYNWMFLPFLPERA